MGTVQYFSGNQDTIVDERNQNQHCIEILEDLLEKAKSGEVVGVSVAIQYFDHSTGEAMGGFLRDRSIMGSLLCLIQRLG